MKNCSEGRNLEGVFPRGLKLEYKSQQQATEPSLSRELLSEAHLPLLRGCRGIVFTHGVRMGGRAVGNSLSGLYLRNRKV